MPNRVVREGIIKSELVDKLSFSAEVFYRRLMSVADDYGRYDGRSVILRADLFPLRSDRIDLEDIGDWKRECEIAGLIKIYLVGGKEFLEVLNFNQRLRSMKSKYPPADVSSCPQMAAVDGGCQQLPADDSKPRLETEAETEVETEADAETPKPITVWNFRPDHTLAIELTEPEIQTALEWIFRLRQTLLTDARVNDLWKAFRLNLTGKKFYDHRQDLVRHFREWLKNQKFDAPASVTTSTTPTLTAREKRDQEKYEKEFGKKAS